MIIIDTSTWIDHFRGIDTLLDSPPAQSVRRLLHPFVYGELLLSGLPKNGAVREHLSDLQKAPVADASEVAAFIEWAGLAGTGIGYVDAHLLVSARMLDNGRLLSQDRSLMEQAQRLNIAYEP
ncbi:VapC toxin family PIN domain ribonuclease [Sphingopyxis sp. BSNA05]|uniref:type II toxin-antitoxin system VapC family toxin n=1 Tax=Sphingopyxis sp. BSNA05 TaxID=1236614 RepID=UPI001564275F|nr:type II toxin-antitoxin system VapC family toxin [Sphingopyxis sp. BSNA05]NRD89013.1 VapC toxin family PIN domain ribonuclease [Sphingopyxis sp. BSNA05]